MTVLQAVEAATVVAEAAEMTPVVAIKQVWQTKPTTQTQSSQIHPQPYPDYSNTTPKTWRGWG